LTTTNREIVTQLRSRFCDAGQGHVFTWWDELSSKEQDRLLKQLSGIDLELLERLIDKNLSKKRDDGERVFEPSSIITIPKTPEEIALREKAKALGENLIRSGQCSAFVVAGSGEVVSGSGPTKGKVPITPVTGKSLFQQHTEKVLALRKRYGVKIPFFVMTSPDNFEETKTFFEENNYFSMEGEDIFFFSQGMLPAVDLSGKLLMEDKGRLYMSPDGHGGSIRSLYSSGALEEMEERGIKYIFYFQVDNGLTKILDPVFLGYHHLAEAEISSKVVRKRSPDERLGTLGLVNGGLGVVEHKDLSKEEMYARDEEGELKFFAGNTAMHILNLSFVRRLSQGAFKLDFHKREGAIDHIDGKGEPVKSSTKNAIRFESFVFDALRHAASSISQEVVREEEFAPFKDMEGENSPGECAKALSRHYKSWLRKAGFQVDEADSVMAEISPLFALDEEGFLQKVKEGRLFAQQLYLE
jgi:UDP-N-acetylglucosamine/UDP-N-acetylgalactosamine diphosphorylase